MYTSLLTVPNAPSDNFESMRSRCLGNSGTVVSSKRFFKAFNTSCCVGDCNSNVIVSIFVLIYISLDDLPFCHRILKTFLLIVIHHCQRYLYEVFEEVMFDPDLEVEQCPFPVLHNHSNYLQ